MGTQRNENGPSDAGLARQKWAQRLAHRVNFEPYIPTRNKTMIGQDAKNSILVGERKANTERHLGITRDTRATVEQVLDPRTMLVLGKMLKRAIFDEIYGCISTGKEANVYYAAAKDPATGKTLE